MLMKDLVDAVADDTGIPKKTIRRVMDSIVHSTHEALIKGDSVRLFGLGCMSVVQRGPKAARNIWTGEKVIVPQRRVVVMSPSDTMTQGLNA